MLHFEFFFLSFFFFFFDQKKVAIDLLLQLWFFLPFHKGCVCHKLCLALCVDDIWELSLSVGTFYKIIQILVWT